MDAATPSALSPNASRALALPFTAEGLLASLRPWVEQESPTFDATAVNAMMSLAMRDMALLGARVERIPGRMGLGDCIRARFAPPDAAEGGILVLAHLDTVHPVGTLATGLPFRVEGDRAFGPGIFDMKGGTVLTLQALAALAKANIPTSRPVTVLLTSDEEIGSPSTRDLIEAEASRHQVVLVPEPGRTDGGVVTGRYAIARFNLRTVGRPSHAGAQLSAGRSAVKEMARKLIAIEDMTTEACTFSVSVMHGGQWVNCVPTFCDAEALTMAKRQPDLDAAVEKMLAMNNASGDVRFEVKRGVTRPVWEPDGAVMGLYEQARRLGAELGLNIAHESAGGGSDGNFTGAMGVPTLDGLGVLGGNAHTLNEHILMDALVPRARLMAALLASV